jgi:hypothetical protein
LLHHSRQPHLDELLLCFFTPDVFGISNSINNILISLSCNTSYNCPALAVLLLLLLLLAMWPVCPLAEAAFDTCA